MITTNTIVNILYVLLCVSSKKQKVIKNKIHKSASGGYSKMLFAPPIQIEFVAIARVLETCNRIIKLLKKK